MRACQPVVDGYVERDGVKVYYEVFGAGEPTVLLLPTWSVMHSRHWKMQIPYLARHCRVLTFDGRGNGRSDRPTEPEAYAESEFAADALAVMDATQTARAVIVGFSMGGHRGLLLAANHPERGKRPSSSARTTRRRAAGTRADRVLLGGGAGHRGGLGQAQPPLRRPSGESRPCGWSSSPAPGSTRPASPPTMDWRSGPSSTSCTGTWPPATSRSCQTSWAMSLAARAAPSVSTGR